MKKLFTAIVAALVALPSFAQFSSGGFELDKENLYFGARIGLSLSGISGDSYQKPENPGNPYRTDISGFKAGLTLGGVIGLRLSSTTPVFLESGVYYTQTGGKKDDITVNMNCIEIPVLVKYGVKVADEIAVLPFFGPYFSHGFTGKTKQPKSFNGSTESGNESIDTYKQSHAITGGLKRNEMGLKIGCGAEYNKLYLEIGFKYSLTNSAKGSDHEYDFTAHPYSLFTNFGVNF